jgi:hypothetical protein
MKVGDLVRNVQAVRTNPAVNERRGWKPVEAGHVGIVVGVRQTDLNATYSKNGKGDVYVDVILAAEGVKVRCGNYHQGAFEVVV